MASSSFVLCCVLALTAIVLFFRPRASGCPAGTSADPHRTARLLSLLSSTPTTRELAQLDIEQKREQLVESVCFSDEAPSALSDHTILLPSHAQEGCQAARLAHLLSHTTSPILTAQPAGMTCETWLAHTREIEQQAHALEEKISLELGCITATDLQPRPTIDDVVNGYRSQCR